MSFNHLLKKDYNEIINKISDESSKIVFKKTLFGKPHEVKKQYFCVIHLFKCVTVFNYS